MLFRDIPSIVIFLIGGNSILAKSYLVDITNRYKIIILIILYYKKIDRMMYKKIVNPNVLVCIAHDIEVSGNNWHDSVNINTTFNAYKSWKL